MTPLLKLLIAIALTLCAVACSTQRSRPTPTAATPTATPTPRYTPTPTPTGLPRGRLSRRVYSLTTDTGNAGVNRFLRALAYGDQQTIDAAVTLHEYTCTAAFVPGCENAASVRLFTYACTAPQYLTDLSMARAQVQRTLVGYTWSLDYVAKYPAANRVEVVLRAAILTGDGAAESPGPAFQMSSNGAIEGISVCIGTTPPRDVQYLLPPLD
jgi:hypothetical protein